MQQIKGSLTLMLKTTCIVFSQRTKDLYWCKTVFKESIWGTELHSWKFHWTFYLLYKPWAALQRSSTVEGLEQGAPWLFAWGGWLAVWLRILQEPQITENTFAIPGPTSLRLIYKIIISVFSRRKITEIWVDSVLKAQSLKKLLNRR